MHVDLDQLAAPRPRLTDGVTVDPVIAEVIRGTMETICFEMAVYGLAHRNYDVTVVRT